MSIEKKSLEDVFLKLTQESDPGLEAESELDAGLESGTDKEPEVESETEPEITDHIEDFGAEDEKGGDN